MAVYFVAYLFGPVVIWAVAGLWPWVERRHAKWIVLGLAIILLLPIGSLQLRHGGLQELGNFALLTLILWTPQYVLYRLARGPRLPTRARRSRAASRRGESDHIGNSPSEIARTENSE